LWLQNHHDVATIVHKFFQKRFKEHALPLGLILTTIAFIECNELGYTMKMEPQHTVSRVSLAICFFDCISLKALDNSVRFMV